MPDHLSRPHLSVNAGGLRRAAVVSAEVLVILLALWASRAAVADLSFVLVPMAFALLLAAFLQPVVGWLARHHVPRGLATLVAMVAGLAAVGGLLAFVSLAVLDSLPSLGDKLAASVDHLRTWLHEGPLHLDNQQLDAAFDRVKSWLGEHQQALLSRTMGVFTTLGQFLAGSLLVVVTLALLLSDGPGIWAFLRRPFRPDTAAFLDEAGRRAFHSVVRYARTTALIALIDATGIGIGLVILGVPLALPLAALVFLGAFVPYVGAFVSGALAVAVAFVTEGALTALIALGVVILVQEIEGHVLQPLLTGNLVRLHPLVVLLAIAIGGGEAGIPGALFAVPAVAAGHAAVQVLAERQAARPKSGSDSGDPPPDGSSARPPA